jgi:pimeloyl-ACP methyl ester carboxylesterase
VSGVPAPLRRALYAGAAILVFVVLVGATYQGVATALERRQYPRPGGLVAVADHQLHIYCLGVGAPAVVLEAPAAGVSGAWGEVQSRVAATTRVCSYDRAGLGWSESSDRPYDPGRVPEELRALLTGAGEQGPFVVVGHGLGALFARMYAALPNSETAALVLIDAPVAGAEGADGIMRVMHFSPWLARAGVLRAGRILSSKAETLNGQAGGVLRAFLNRPDHLARAAREIENWEPTVRMAMRVELKPTLPVVTVQASGQDRVAFLTDPAEIEFAVRGIEDAVARVRAGER